MTALSLVLAWCPQALFPSHAECALAYRMAMAKHRQVAAVVHEALHREDKQLLMEARLWRRRYFMEELIRHAEMQITLPRNAGTARQQDLVENWLALRREYRQLFGDGKRDSFRRFP